MCHVENTLQLWHDYPSQTQLLPRILNRFHQKCHHLQWCITVPSVVLYFKLFFLFWFCSHCCWPKHPTEWLYVKSVTYRLAWCIWAVTLNLSVVALVGWCTDLVTFIAWSWQLTGWSWCWWWNVCGTGWWLCWCWRWHTDGTACFGINVTLLGKGKKKWKGNFKQIGQRDNLSHSNLFDLN